MTDEAITLIRQRDQEKPFFLNLWHYDVHIPCEAKEDQILYFEEKAKKMGLDQKNPFVEGEFFPIEKKKDLRLCRRTFQSDPVYAAMIYNLDLNIGRLLDALEAEGLTENTLVVFTSDNGGLSTSLGSPTSNAPAREGKGWMYEGGVRVPMIAVWPNHIRPGSECDYPITSTDFFPTYLEAAGLPLMPDLHKDGQSMIPLLEEHETPAQRPIFWHYPHYGELGCTPGSSVRLGKFKLLEFFEDMHVELYDLENDFSEDFNLSETLPEKTAELLDLLHSWRNSIEGKIPQANPDYVPWPRFTTDE
ncbi:sulfatase-like hydrolase/transferase [Bengtsoniella intestinalis]|uniref:sulfatase-like hydrolase/transferase n=1 Tax=Bengtsoniella intestinalis TaxID=3073143 RepID=UPI00391F5C57